MSPKERKFWYAANRRANAMQPDVAQAILRAFSILRDSLTDAELARLIDSGDVDRVFREILNEQTMDRAFIPLRQRLRNHVETSVKYFTKDLPKGGKIDGVIAVQFDVLNPRVIDAVRTLDTKVTQSLSTDARQALLTSVEQGLRDGKNPREIAKQARAGIGMSPTQEVNAGKFEAKLRAKADPPTEEQIARQVATYRKRAIALNADTNARTASLDAMKLGQTLSWRDARDKGVIPDGAQMTKTWRGTLDDRERPSHRAMEGVTVPFDAPYPNGQMQPGDTEFNCRCISIIRVA